MIEEFLPGVYFLIQHPMFDGGLALLFDAIGDLLFILSLQRFRIPSIFLSTDS